ncbi:MAG: YgiT-type zinc finger protein [Nitrococcus mobilis]|nr:YgiT-type zinc finger protein [Nitrococcus mobilis]
MKCHVCGGTMESVATDLPFKLDDRRILIVKGLPIEQCASCGEYLISDAVMQVLDQLIEDTNEAVELEIRRYAA